MTADLHAPTESPRWRIFKRRLVRFRRRPMAIIGICGVAIFVLLALGAPLLAPYSPGETNYEAVVRPPSSDNLLGTDGLGRDVLSRVIWSSRTSILAGVFSTAIAMALAVPIGLLVGYYRGWLDSVVMRVNDALLAFPFIVIAIGLSAIFGPSLTNASIAIGVSQMPKLLRVTRGEVLSAREEEYVAGAVVDGSTDFQIMGRHILPNISSTIIVQATIILPFAIIAESVLSFLGLGVQPPTPSWGVMLSAAQPYLSAGPWLAVFPGLAIFLTTMSFNLLGDGLRDVLDPKITS